MTVENRNPINPNSIQPNKFTFNFGRAPNLQYFCQTISFPGLSLSEIIFPTPLVDLPVPGEKAIYEPLSITFIVDAELLGWLEMHDWLRALTFPTDFKEYGNLRKLNQYTTAKNSKQPQYSEGSVTLLSASNKPYYRFKFVDLFPISLSGFVLSSTESPDSIITADATFRYSYYDVEKLF
jgi:hypothetical protein